MENLWEMIAKARGVELAEEFIVGEREITKLPFKPKYGDTYWTYYGKPGRINSFMWNDEMFDYKNKLLGIVFRTKEDAERNLPLFLERLEKEC